MLAVENATRRVDSRIRGKDNDITVSSSRKRGSMLAVENATRRVDSRIRGKDNDIFVMYRDYNAFNLLPPRLQNINLGHAPISVRYGLSSPSWIMTVLEREDSERDPNDLLPGSVAVATHS